MKRCLPIVLFVAACGGASPDPAPAPAPTPSPAPVAKPAEPPKPVSQDDAQRIAEQLWSEEPHERRPLKYELDDVRTGPQGPKAAGSAGPSKPADPTMNADEAARFAELMTGAGQAKEPGDMARRTPTGTLGGSVAVGTGRGPGTPTPGGASVGRGGGKISDPTPTGRISVASKTALDTSTLTVDAVVAKIQSAYLPGVRRCYKYVLAKDTTARGKVKLDIPVNPAGRVVGAKAKGFSAELDGCISQVMGMWTFPPPKTDAGEGTDAAFEIQLMLSPD